MASITDVAAAEPRSKFWILLTTSLVSLLIMLDSNIVAVSLPAIGRSLHASFTDIQWVVTAYLLSYAGLLLAAGALADLGGRKRAMLLGLVVFAVASAACGVAQSSLVLNLARAAQGIGGALLLTAALAILSHTFNGTARAHAFAIWGACIGIALTAGPIVGGLITNFFGWRWVFLVNIPACVVLITAAIAVVEESRDLQATRLDIAGILTFSPGLFLLVWALIDGNDKGWSSAAILSRFGVGAIFFVAFVVAELRQQRPMVDLALFRRSTFLGSVFAMLGYGAAAQVMVFYLPLFLQNPYGFAPAVAGVAMIPFAAPMVLVPHLTAGKAGHLSGRAILSLGLAVTLIGNLLFWLVARAALPYGVFVLGMLVAGSGAGLLNGETVKVMSLAVLPERAGMASGLASTTRFIGILFGAAGLGAVLARMARDGFIAAALAAGLGPVASDAAAKQVTSGNLTGMLESVPAAVRPMLHQAGLHAFGAGFGAASLLAAIVAALACVLTFRFVRRDDTKTVAVPKQDRPCKFVDCRDPI